MYYEYWRLQKAPFDNVPDPAMYADCHETMERAIAETRFAIEEGEDCVSVIVGDVGLGKTMSIRIVIDSLDQEKYKIALVTNPGLTFVQLMKEIIGQVTGKQCEENKKVNLLEMFNKILFETVDEGKKVIIIIDEANVITPKNLEDLRLLTNMQDDERNLFTMVLVGQLELARRLEQQKFANLFQRVGTYNKIEKIQTRDLVKAYVETRLGRVGADRDIFAEDAYDFLWQHSEHGVPRLINKICKLSLKAGETNGFSEIKGEIVNQIGIRFQKIAWPALPRRMSRKKQVEDVLPVPAEAAAPVVEKSDLSEMPEHISEEKFKAVDFLGNDLGAKAEITEEMLDLSETVMSAKDDEHKTEDVLALDVETELVEEMKAPIELPSLFDEGKEDIEEIKIGESRITVRFPSDFIQRAQAVDLEDQVKMAGDIAAQTLKENPQMEESLLVDPVPVWEEIKDFVLRRIDKRAK